MEQFNNGLGMAWQNTAAFLPKLALFLLILVAGYFLSRLLAKAFDKVLERTGFDRLVERGGIKRALARTQYDASGLLSKTLFYAVFLFVLQLAFGVFGPTNPISELLTAVISFLPSLVVAVLIVVIASAVAKGVKDIVGSALAGASYGRFVSTAASITIITVGVFAALSQIGIAPAIVNALFYAVLAIVAGSAIVAIGGAGIAPLRGEWERALGRLRTEGTAMHSRVEQASQGIESAVREWEEHGAQAAPEGGKKVPPPAGAGRH
jgi:hypothetical protein